MSLKKKSLRDLPPQALDGKRALVRVDFNVPLKNGKITDDTRLRASLPTIKYLRDKGARVVLLSHLGRPKGGPDPQYSLKQIVPALEKLLGAPIEFIPDPATGMAATRRLTRGGVALVENTRFWPGEEQNDAELAKTFAALGDLYVNDAFGSAHRAHASTAAVAHLLKPAVSGFLNFGLLDEDKLGGWQSGLLWRDGSRKPSYDAFKSAIAEIRRRDTDCSKVRGAPTD